VNGEKAFCRGRLKFYPALAVEIVSAQVDIVVAGTSTGVHPMQQANSTIPIVIAVATDP